MDLHFGQYAHQDLRQCNSSEKCCTHRLAGHKIVVETMVEVVQRLLRVEQSPVWRCARICSTPIACAMGAQSLAAVESLVVCGSLCEKILTMNLWMLRRPPPTPFLAQRVSSINADHSALCQVCMPRSRSRHRYQRLEFLTASVGFGGSWCFQKDILRFTRASTLAFRRSPSIGNKSMCSCFWCGGLCARCSQWRYRSPFGDLPSRSTPRWPNRRPSTRCRDVLRERARLVIYDPQVVGSRSASI